LAASLRALEGVLSAGLKAVLSECARNRAWALPAGLPSAQQERLALARAAFDYHAQKPNLITFSGLQPTPSLSTSANRAIQELHDGLVGGARLDETIVPPQGALICFGAGLHIPLLLKAYPTRDLIVVDPHPGSLCQVFADQDWQAVLEHVTQQGGRLSFVCHSDPVVAAMAAVAAARRDNLGLIDGSRVVVGYRDEAVAAAANAFMERRVNLVVYNGYVEDEELLLRFSAQNLLNGKALSMGAALDRPAPMPAVIVGSGPSLDTSIQALKRHREKVAVFSCGSALLALLEHGIRPDVHCELEADPYIDDILRYSAVRHDLSDIRLVAANTVFPGILEHFAAAALCVREGTLASRLFAGAAPLPLIAPSCTNTGASFAYALGFREIVLCGVDLGARQADRHHAEATVYDNVEDYNAFVGEDRVWMQPKSSASTVFDRKVAANFGGDAFTNDDMLQMRTAFELLAADRGAARFVNLSDGAKIAGFTAQGPDAYLDALPMPEMAPGTVLDSAFAQLSATHGDGPPVDIERLRRFLDLLDEWEQQAVAVFSGAASSGSAVALYDAVRPLLQPDETAAQSTDLWDACRYTFTGTLMKLFHYLRYADARLGEEDRRRLLELVEACLPPIVADMTALLRARVTEICDQISR